MNNTNFTMRLALNNFRIELFIQGSELSHRHSYAEIL